MTKEIIFYLVCLKFLLQMGFEKSSTFSESIRMFI